MISPADKITKAALDALATLANAKLAPGTPYAFNAIAGRDKVGLPSDITIARQFPGVFPAGSKVTLRLYAYHTLGGIKYFSAEPLVKAFYDDRPAASAPYALTWSWTPIADGTRPDGYIVAIPVQAGGGWIFAWQDIGAAITLTETGALASPPWNYDVTLDANNLGNPSQNLPCGRGAWLKPFTQIHADLLSSLDIFGGARVFDDTWLVSGPWCVAVAPKCYLYLGGATRKAAFANLRFIYSEADSPTGNQLAPEADMLNTFIGVNNGVNNFNWDANVKINGTIKFYALPAGQTAADWNITVSDPSITWVVTPNDFYTGGGGFPATSIEFTFTDIQYTVGTPIVLTVTPLSGGDVSGQFALVNCTFTGDSDTYAAADTIAIHTAGTAAKSAALDSTLTPITFTNPGGPIVLETHYRCFCNGVFVANTLPTLGLMSFLDMDLPQYSPNAFGGRQAGSSQRLARNTDLPYMPGIDYMASRFPTLRDTDFIPDNVNGRAVNGSKAWQSLGTKNATSQIETESIPPAGAGNDLFYTLILFVPSGAPDLRLLADNPNVFIYAKAGDFPTVADHDISGPGGAWLSTAASIPGFATGTTWFVGILNPTAADILVTSTGIVISDVTLPTGTFFPTLKDDNGNTVAQLEGDSFHFADPASTDQRPIPLFGYCVHALTVSRLPGASTIAPLAVKIGLMPGFGFDTAGVFSEIQTIIIPAGQTSIVVQTFLPVLAGTPLAYQCTEELIIYSAVNFQPMMHSTFNAATTKLNGQDYSVGTYSGAAWYEPLRALLFFDGGNSTKPILLPIAATIYNDLTAALNLL